MSDFFGGMQDLNRLSVDLTKAALSAGPKAVAAVHKTASDIEATGKILAVVDTGAMMNSIGIDYGGDSIKTIEATVGPTVDYAPFVEWGTSRMAPRAFMGPAFDRHSHELDTALASLAGDIL